MQHAHTSNGNLDFQQDQTHNNEERSSLQTFELREQDRQILQE
jgi:hypothetical protein